MNNRKSFNTAIVTSGLIILGVLTAGYFMLTDTDNHRIWRALLVNYLFFTSAAAGMVVLPAIIIVSNGKWMGTLEKICWTGISFSVPSIIALIVLWIGANDWAPWIKMIPHKAWLNTTFLFTRNLLFQSIFWILAYFFLKNRYNPQKVTIAGWLIFAYVVAFSFTGFDLVMTLKPEWYSMMIGGYFFISGLYTAVALWIFLSILLIKPLEGSVLYDPGRLLITFCMLTSYTMFSQLLPIWYENLPEETTFLVPRMNLAWKPISYLLLGIVYLGPFLLLLNRDLKQNLIYMSIISLMVLVGMWIERWWLVSAVFEKDKILFGSAEIITTVAFAGLLSAGVLLMVKVLPGYIKSGETSIIHSSQ